MAHPPQPAAGGGSAWLTAAGDVLSAVENRAAGGSRPPVPAPIAGDVRPRVVVGVVCGAWGQLGAGAPLGWPRQTTTRARWEDRAGPTDLLVRTGALISPEAVGAALAIGSSVEAAEAAILTGGRSVTGTGSTTGIVVVSRGVSGVILPAVIWLFADEGVVGVGASLPG